MEVRPASLNGNSTAGRTIVFVDYQNMYRSAREAFGWRAKPGRYGSFRPHELGRQIVRDSSRVLTEVRVYTGIHAPYRNTAQYSQMQRRMLAWVAEAPQKIQVFPRMLRYEANSRAHEKGVDVEMAVDIVSLAIDDAFDVVALASADTDLVPALQFVADRFPQKRIVTVAYQPLAGCKPPPAVDVPCKKVERRLVTAKDFAKLADRTDYYKPASDPSKLIDATRVARIKRRSTR